MKRIFPTALLLGMFTLGGLAWQQTGQAEHAAEPAAQSAESPAAPSLPAIEVADGPHAAAIRGLLATAPGPERDAAAAAFRELGPDAFAALYEALSPSIESYRAYKSFGFATDDAQAGSDIRLLDAVAQQRDAYAAGLYWYTDLDAAKARAQATGKPILSLRMLGNLDEEYSCANSRFFRTVLYADAELGQQLREDFVLHWHSLRPVPVITIDMGDGRVIRRTITGNSCHLVMDPQGRPIDVIPGLYGPRAFEKQIERAAGLAATLHGLTENDRRAVVATFHRSAADLLDARWAELTAGHTQSLQLEPGDETILQPDLELSALALTNPVPGVTPPPVVRTTVQVPDARAALQIGGKRMVEEVMVDAVLPPRPLQAPGEATDQVWEQVAAFYADSSVLDDASRRLIREKTITAEQAMRMALSKSRVEDPLLAMVQNFQGAIALDTARNEHLLHREIHQWFVAGEPVVADADTLTSRVYAELFLTPDEDPWLGLVPADTYSALDQGGLEVCETK